MDTMILHVVQKCFKFQSDSINTLQKVQKNIQSIDFKFQSDSINTVAKGFRYRW